jgi:hypothetical protein
MTTTATEELRTYLSLRAPHWSHEMAVIDVLATHGHTVAEIKVAVIELKTANEIEISGHRLRLRTSSVDDETKFLGVPT